MDFLVQPFDHQVEALNFLLEKGSGALFMEPGTGKTKVAIDYARTIRAKRVLVICPKSLLGVWQAEVKKNAGKAYICVRPKAKNPRRKKGQGVFFLTTYEYFRIHEVDFCDIDWDLLIIDESHLVKNRNAKRTKAILRVSRDIDKRVLLTGTPVTNNYIDLWAQLRIIDKGILGDYKKFEEKYVVKGGFYGYEIKGFRNVKTLMKKVEKVSIIKRKIDCLDLPDKTIIPVPIELPKKVMKQYQEFDKEMVLSLEGKTGVAASIVLSKCIRLSQMTSGFIPTYDLVSEEKKGIVDLHTAKLEATYDLVDSITSSGESVVIFCRFLWEIHKLADWLSELDDVYMMTGSSSEQDRERILKVFTDNPSILLLQSQVGGLGLNLQCSNYAIFYSLDYSFANFSQAQDRLHRIGQKNPVTYYILNARSTIDEDVYEALRQKRNFLDVVMKGESRWSSDS